MTDDHEEELLRSARHYRDQLTAHVEATDQQTLLRLAEARRAALELRAASAHDRPFRVPGVWLPAGVFACAALLALAVWIYRPVPPTGPTAVAAAVEDVELLASGDEAEIYTEDAVFYEWAGAESGAI
jgi:hypothetical protein